MNVKFATKLTYLQYNLAVKVRKKNLLKTPLILVAGVALKDRVDGWRGNDSHLPSSPFPFPPLLVLKGGI